MLQLEITIRDIDNTPAIDSDIRKKVEKLEQLYDRITHCHVVVESIQRKKLRGKLYQVNIEVHVPNRVLIVNNSSHRNKDLYVAIRDAFDAMKRQLEDHVHRMRGDTKVHTPQKTGTIVRLFPDYGFIETDDGNEYYFHQASVNTQFSNLDVGRTVRFVEALAGDGLQAQNVMAA